MTTIPQAPRVAVLVVAAVLLACGGEEPAQLELESQSSALTDGPDLVVQSVSGPTSATSGSGFQVTVTVCNQGTQQASAPTAIFLSTDAVITSADTQIGQAPSTGLTPGACTTLTTSGGAYVPNGPSYYLGAIVDLSNFVVELSESNNTRAGNRIGVGNAPDFVVSQVSGPSGVTSATNGSQLTVSVQLCNQGTQPGSVPVDIYLSADTNITTADYQVGSLPGGPSLPPGACAALSGPVWVSAPSGGYYLGAIADRPNYTVELIENNNTAAGNRIGMGQRPDFTIASVSSTTSATLNGPLTVTFTLCNQGTQPGGVPVDLYLSTDANITTADFWLGSVPPPSPSLAAGTCINASGTLPANAPGGAYYAGAIADRSNAVLELIENNNALAGNRVGVGNAADLAITQVSAPPSAVPGGPLSVTVTVCNHGTQSASAPVELYLSTDATITTADVWVGSVPPGPSLMPGACATLTGNAWTPGPGVTYVGAIVDRDLYVPELIEANNAAAGNRVSVGSGPDLIVSQVSTTPSVLSGGQLSFTATVCNQGTQSGGAPVDLYLSADATITGADSWVGSLPPGPPLQPGACAIVTGSGYASVPDGVYYAGAIADRPNSLIELLEDNNALAGNRVGVGSKPDLIISQVSSSPSAISGGTLTINVTACNQGTQSGGAMADLYLSFDATITAGDFSLGSAGTPPLQPGACSQISINKPANAPNGAYYVGAIADRNNSVAELIEDNNAAAGNQVGVGNAADLVVTSVTAPPSAYSYSAATVTVTICNQGTQAGEAKADVFYSTDATITVSDFYAGTPSPTQYLSPGACTTVSGSLPVPVPDGVYFVGAIADRSNSVGELIESNNATAGGKIGVGSGPDLVVSQVSTVPSATPGSTVQLTATVCNQGTQPGGAPVEIFFSTDATITSADYPAGSFPPGPWLMPGACTSLSGSAYAPGPDGVYYVGAIVDGPNSIVELREDNNVTAGNRMGVGYRPDLIVTQVSTGPSAPPGSQLQVTVTVCNQGTQSGSAPVELFFSSDATITPLDFPAGPLPPGPPLMPGACATLSGYAFVPSPDGVYYVGAIADVPNSLAELIEDNNATAGNRVGIGNRPDFIITQVSTGPSAPPGGQVLVSVTFCNQGTQSASTQVELFFSTDATISSSDYPAGYLSPGPLLMPGACATRSGAAYVPAPEGVYYLGAIADVPNSVVELIEDNNAAAGTRVGVGYRPDFTITQVSTDASALPGSQVQVTVTVCNQGTQSGSAPVDLFFSADATITTSDYPAGYLAPGPWLMPGACTTQSDTAYVPGSGVFYVGAIIDGNNNVLELIEDNNATAGNRVGVGYGSDLIITQVSAPTSGVPGSPVPVTVTVCNQGTQSGSAEVELYFSSDATITGGDFWSGSIPPGPPLAPGACATQSGTAYAPPNGAYYAGAIVDRQNWLWELIEDNNAEAGNRIGIGYGPDLVISQVVAPPSAMPGSSVQVTATVCNQGTQSGSAQVDVFFSPDATIGPGDYWSTSLPPSPWLAPGACATLSGMAYVPPDGAYYVGAYVDAPNYLYELIEDNNGKAGNRVGVGYAPDLLITAVTGPTSAPSWSYAQVTATVCNQGTAGTNPGPIDVFLSGDSTITAQDFLIGSLPSPGSLGPGVCLTVSGQVSLSAGAGTYWLGAMADRYGSISELFEDNNAKAGGTIQLQ